MFRQAFWQSKEKDAITQYSLSDIEIVRMAFRAIIYKVLPFFMILYALLKQSVFSPKKDCIFERK